MPTPISPDLIDRYLAGELPPEAAAQVRAYLDADPSRRGFMAGISAAIRGEELGPRPAGEASREEMLARINAVGDATRRQSSRDLRALARVERGKGRIGKWPLRHDVFSRRAPLPWTGHTAAGTAFIALGVTAIIGFQSQRRHQIAPPVRTYTTSAGQQETVTLADGAQALLGPATTLSVIAQPSGRGVDVRVMGQVLFTVTHSEERPFRVQAGNAIARVIGTTFMVRRYDLDTVARILVTSGRVSLIGTRNTAILGTGCVLTAGALGTVDDSGRVRVTPATAVEDYIGWTRGQLVFRQMPIRDVVVELSHAYGVDLRVTDSALAARTLDWTVSTTQQSITDVLEFLAVVLDVRPIRSGNTITLVPGQSASRRPVELHSPLTSERRYGR